MWCRLNGRRTLLLLEDRIVAQALTFALHAVAAGRVSFVTLFETFHVSDHVKNEQVVREFDVHW